MVITVDQLKGKLVDKLGATHVVSCFHMCFLRYIDFLIMVI